MLHGERGLIHIAVHLNSPCVMHRNIALNWRYLLFLNLNNKQYTRRTLADEPLYSSSSAARILKNKRRNLYPTAGLLRSRFVKQLSLINFHINSFTTISTICTSVSLSQRPVHVSTVCTMTERPPPTAPRAMREWYVNDRRVSQPPNIPERNKSSASSSTRPRVAVPLQADFCCRSIATAQNQTPATTHTVYAHSITWTSEEEKIRESYVAMLKTASHLGFLDSPFLPKDVVAYVEVLADNKIAKTKRLVSKIRQATREKRPVETLFQGKIGVDEDRLSAVLAENVGPFTRYFVGTVSHDDWPSRSSFRAWQSPKAYPLPPPMP